MDDPNQIEVPPSFVALFTSPGGHRLTQPMDVVRERYELCEDLAQVLGEQASADAFKSGGSPGEVLARMQAALAAEGSSLRDGEPAWVVTRVAEILDWKIPAAS